MKLFDVVLFSLSVAFTLISIYEMITNGIGYAYGFVMLAVICFISYSYRKKRRA